MPASVVEGYPNERSNDFFGKDAMLWWIGEVEDNKDPLQIGRCKVRILGWYTNPEGGTTKDLPTEELPWALALQPTTQAGNDGQGDSSGQLQPGAIVMGFFFDGEEGQQPVIMGVIRIVKGEGSRKKPYFAITGESNPDYVNAATAPAGEHQAVGANDTTVANTTNSVQTAGKNENSQPNANNPSNVGTQTGSGSVTPAAQMSTTPIAAADGVGGPVKTLKMHLQNILDVAAKEFTGLTKDAESGQLVRAFDNVPVATENILAAIKNAIMAIAAQAVAAMREWLNELAGKLSKGGSLITTLTGIPASTMILIKTAIELILKQLCILDNQIVQFALNPINSIVSLFEAAIGKAMDAISLASQAMDDLIGKLMDSFNALLCKVKGLVAAVEAIVAAVGAAVAIINAWKSGKKVLADKVDLRKMTFESFLQIVIMILNMFDMGCNRSRQNSKNLGWVPILGSTYCADDDDGKAIMKKLGAPSCGSGGTGNATIDWITNIYQTASPYLTSARTELSGYWEQHIGNPGSNADTVHLTSGTTHTSIRKDPAEEAKAKATEKATKAGQTKAQAEKAGNQAAKGKSGPIVGDHSSYAAAYTVDVAKDLCYKVTGHEIHTISGDLRLKVTGNFHLEVGGGMFVNAVGAPQVEPKEKGTGGAGKAQKHSILFGSDADISVSGGTLKVNSTELNMNSMSTNVGAPTGTFAIDSPSVNIRGGDILMTASNSMNFTSISENHLVNTPPSKLGIKTGVFYNVFGPVDYILLPAKKGDGVIPKFSVTNTKGPFLVTCGAAGAAFTVAKGAFLATVAAGAITMTAAKGAVAITASKGAVTITAGAAVAIIGKTISLN